jgi:quinol monooxygenase YgiN
MFIVHVFVHVKSDQVEAFKSATIENASNSIQEPGVARFDIIQQMDDPTRFVLVEVYRTPDDPGRHKETAHYQKWRDTVGDMMAEPRTAIKYTNIFPDEQGWG